MREWQVEISDNYSLLLHLAQRYMFGLLELSLELLLVAN